MSSATGVTNSLAAYGQAAFSTGVQLQRAFEGDKQRVRFMVNGQTKVQFDAVLQETHGVETMPTAFPVEDGSTVGDHIIVAPLELNLTGIVTDSPLNNRSQLFRGAITSVANNTLGPLGVLGATAAFATANAQWGTGSPSFAAFATLCKMAVGDTTGAVPTPPVPFDVYTRVRVYKSMVIRSVSAPRDATTGKAMVFTVQLQQMVVVASQSLRLELSKLPQVTSIKQRLEQEGGDSDVAEQYQRGVNRADIATGQAQRFPGVKP